MPLHHHKQQLRDELLESTFSGDSCRAPLPASLFPQSEMRADETFQAISDELLLDGNARQNLATFCQTWEEAEVHRLMDLSINKNMIDKDEYPQTAEIERRCVQMLADLWNAPTRAEPSAARPSGRRRRACSAAWPPSGAGGPSARPQGKPTDKPNMVCGPVQVVWHKFAKYWDIEMREIPMSPGQVLHGRRADAGPGRREHDHGGPHLRRDLHRRLRAGGSSSPQALDTLQADTGLDIDIHVDGASGAFLAPFCAPDVGLGLPAPEGQVDQHLGPQVRPRPARGGLGALARRRRSSPMTSSSTSPTWAATCRSSRSTSPGPPARSWPSTTTSSGWAGRATGDVHDACYDIGQFLAEEIVKLGPLRAALRL